MPLLNYTTEVAATRTVTQIHEILAKAGARSIAVDYHADGRPSGVSFRLETTYGSRTFVLPVNVAAVFGVMKARDSKVPPRYQSRDQAERVAWRILKDWLEAQLAIISTEQVTADQVLLPYMVTDELGTTVYEQYRNGQKALEAGA